MEPVKPKNTAINLLISMGELGKLFALILMFKSMPNDMIKVSVSVVSFLIMNLYVEYARDNKPKN